MKDERDIKKDRNKGIKRKQRRKDTKKGYKKEGIEENGVCSFEASANVIILTR
jgi:hypothetical protein